MEMQYSEDGFEIGNSAKTIAELNQEYKEAEEVDKLEFSEMRVNLQLVAGDHFMRPGSRFWNRIRESKNITTEQRLKIVKNHIGRIATAYQNFILESNPDVFIQAKQEKEIQHQKAAEQHHSVWTHFKEEHNLARKKFLWCKDYVEVGEAAVKVFWDKSLGRQVGWEPEIDPETGQDAVDPMTGELIQSNRPIMSGGLVFETIHGFDLLRQPGVKAMEDSQYHIIRKMASVKDLLKAWGHDEEKAAFIKESNQDTFRAFSPQGGVAKTKGMTMVREHYYKKCAQYPNGYYYICTELGVLDEGELPFGIYPIHYVGFDELTTSPRAKSKIRQLRPFQIELNRAASKIGEIQITLGSDRVWYQAGSKPSSGATKPGIRENSYVGQAPIIQPGQVGEQYFGYIQQIQQEMYTVADLADLDAEVSGQLDPYTLLFRSAKQKKKFSYYIDKFNEFQVSICKTALQLYKKYAHPSDVIPVIGKNEQVNIEEFKNSSDLLYQITVKPMSDDLETTLGKQITINHYLQYVGTQLKPQDIGKMMRMSPYLNKEIMFKEMTQNYDNLQNDLLSMDRGKYREPNLHDDHKYVIDGLITRMKSADFEFLPPQVQQLYQVKKQAHEKIMAEQAEAVKQAQAGLIPSGGYLVTCDLYVSEPNDPTKTKRVRLPSEAIVDLIKKLEKQGSGQKVLQDMNPQAQAEIAQMITQGGQQASDNGQMQPVFQQ